jgi:hypothetical protein
LLKQKGRAQEDIFFAQEDSKLLEKMLENSESMNSDSDLDVGIAETVEQKIKLVFMKHGIPPFAHPEPRVISYFQL